MSDDVSEVFFNEDTHTRRTATHGRTHSTDKCRTVLRRRSEKELERGIWGTGERRTLSFLKFELSCLSAIFNFCHPIYFLNDLDNINRTRRRTGLLSAGTNEISIYGLTNDGA
jgi:hypothetical protein